MSLVYKNLIFESLVYSRSFQKILQNDTIIPHF